MQKIAQLKAMHEQMMADLAILPQYRALKAMDRFLAEMAQIYKGQPALSEKGADGFQQKLNAAIENRVGGDLQPNTQMRVTHYVPGNRVA